MTYLFFDTETTVYRTIACRLTMNRSRTFARSPLSKPTRLAAP